jgi:hypothetical protein
MRMREIAKAKSQRTIALIRTTNGNSAPASASYIRLRPPLPTSLTPKQGMSKRSLKAML